MTSVEEQFTMQQAADILNVPRHFLVKLLDEGEISYTKVRRHRRIRAEDLFAYKEKRDAIRTAAVHNITRMDSENGLL